MDIDVFPRHELSAVMRTLRTALRTDGPLDAREQAFLDTYARITGFGWRAGDADWTPIDLDTLSIEDAHARKRLLQLAALAVLHARPVRSGSFAFLRALARRLDVHDPVIEVIDALMRGRPFTVRLLAMRRAMRALLKEAWTAEGWIGIPRFLGALLFGLSVNKDQHARYKRLGLLPEGTLGREYWKHMTEVGFGFPGEPNGIAANIAYHDIAHVLCEHPTTGPGEIQQGSFQAGNRREDGFFFLQFVVLHFHHGVKVTPAAPAEEGHFDAAKVLWALHRGAQCNVDMTHQWDYWPLMALPMAEARARVALLPKLDASAARPLARVAA